MADADRLKKEVDRTIQRTMLTVHGTATSNADKTPSQLQEQLSGTLWEAGYSASDTRRVSEITAAEVAERRHWIQPDTPPPGTAEQQLKQADAARYAQLAETASDDVRALSHMLATGLMAAADDEERCSPDQLAGYLERIADARRGWSPKERK